MQWKDVKFLSFQEQPVDGALTGIAWDYLCSVHMLAASKHQIQRSYSSHINTCSHL